MFRNGKSMEQEEEREHSVSLFGNVYNLLRWKGFLNVEGRGLCGV